MKLIESWWYNYFNKPVDNGRNDIDGTAMTLHVKVICAHIWLAFVLYKNKHIKVCVCFSQPCLYFHPSFLLPPQRMRRAVWRRTCLLQELVSILRPTSMVQGTTAALPGSSQHPLCWPLHDGHPWAMMRRSTTLQWKANRRRSRNQKRSTATYHQRSVFNIQVRNVSRVLVFYCHAYFICLISQQLSVKEFYLKIIPWRLFTFRVCPGTKVKSELFKQHLNIFTNVFFFKKQGSSVVHFLNSSPIMGLTQSISTWRWWWMMESSLL